MRKSVTTRCDPGTENWARFTDWLEERLGRPTDWTVIAKTFDAGRPSTGSFTENLATFSYLVDPQETPLDGIFSDTYWDLHADFEALVDRTSATGEDVYVDALRQGKLHPLTQFRSSIGDYPAEWRIWPALEDYYNLRRARDGHLVDPYTGARVVEVPEDADNEPIRVRTDYLREYLAARRMVLIRQHDHTRLWKGAIEGLGQTVSYGDLQRTGWGCYVLNVVNRPRPGEFRFSRLVAKDFIPPFDAAGRVGGRRLQSEPSDCPEFIVGQELSGQLEFEQPSEHDLGSPVYFDPKVLKRYYDEPARFSVGFWAPSLGGVSGLNWSIPLGRNEEGVIIAWLGDFLKKGVPMEEIRHWRAHNIVPRGRMAEDFWNSQMMCTPPSQPSLESRLRDTRYHLQKALEGRGKSVFRAYEGPDKHAEKTLREPLYDEYLEFHSTIRVLSIVFVEYLDLDHFKAALLLERLKDERGRTVGGIVLFTNWLEDALGVSAEVAGRVKSALQRLQAVRSNISGSHRFSDSGYQKSLTKLELKSGASAREVYCAVAEPLAEALERLCFELGIRDQLWWLKRSA